MDKLDGEILKVSVGAVYDELYFSDGCLLLDSEVYGDDFDSEAHYAIDAENTQKLLRAIGGEKNPFDSVRELFKDELSCIKLEEICGKYNVKYTYICI